MVCEMVSKIHEEICPDVLSLDKLSSEREKLKDLVRCREGSVYTYTDKKYIGKCHIWEEKCKYR